MARTVNQWRSEVERELERAGVEDLFWSFTGSTHQRVTGTITVKGGKRVSVSLTCSVSPSDHRALYRVRSDIKRMVANARRMEDAA